MTRSRGEDYAVCGGYHTPKTAKMPIGCSHCGSTEVAITTGGGGARNGRKKHICLKCGHKWRVCPV